jgi:hypothetical protein
MNMTVDIYLVQTQNGHFLKAKNQNSVAVTCIFGIIIPVNHTIVYIKFNTANKNTTRMGGVFLLAEDEDGFERAAPVRTLVQKHAGESMFLARGRIH